MAGIPLVGQPPRRRRVIRVWGACGPSWPQLLAPENAVHGDRIDADSPATGGGSRRDFVRDGRGDPLLAGPCRCRL